MGDRLLSILSRAEVWGCGLGVAAFLALYWVIRGAPLGQTPEGADGESGPTPRQRDVSIAAAVIGLIIVVAGGFVAVARSIPWSLPLFVFGFGAIMFVAKGSRRHRHESPTMRRLSRFCDAALTAVLLGGILLIANVLAFRYGDRPIDLTSEHVYTLESLSSNQMKGLKAPVRFTAFYVPGVPFAGQQFRRVVQLLELYKTENPRQVTVETVDAARDPLRFDELAKRAPDVLVAAGGVVIEYGADAARSRNVVRFTDMFDLSGFNPYSPARSQLDARFHGEDAITSALVRLKEGKMTKVALIAGHGEPSFDEMDDSAFGRGLGQLKARLAGLGMEPVAIDLGSRQMPAEITLALIIAPRTPFASAEIDRLTQFMNRGGRLFASLDGLRPTGLEAWLKTYNVGLESGVIVDRTASEVFGGNPTALRAAIGSRGGHPIVAALANQSVIFFTASPLDAIGFAGEKANSAPTPNQSFIADVVLRTGPNAYVKRDPRDVNKPFAPKQDFRGPITIGVAVTGSGKAGSSAGDETPRMVVLGSSFVADNFFASRNDANLNLVTNALNWLRGRSDLQGIAPRTRAVPKFELDDATKSRLVLLPTIMSLSLIAGIGVSVYVARRR